MWMQTMLALEKLCYLKDSKYIGLHIELISDKKQQQQNKTQNPKQQQKLQNKQKPLKLLFM